MQSCTYEVDDNGYVTWDPECPRHGAKEQNEQSGE
jgi:ribosomal protein S27AE